MEKTEIAVGDSVKLEILFSTGAYYGTIVKRTKICVDRDSLCRYIEMRTNFITQPDSTFPLVVSPYRLILTKTDSIDVTNVRFQIANRSDSTVFVRIIDYPKEYFSLSLPAKTESGLSVSGFLALSFKGRQNSFNKSLTFECDDASRSRFTIPVVRRIIGQGEIMTTFKSDPECPE